MVVRAALSKIESPGLVRERRERFLVRRKYLEGIEAMEKKQRRVSMVPGEADLDEIVADDVEGSFWLEQGNPRGTVAVGKDIISRASTKKTQ